MRTPRQAGHRVAVWRRGAILIAAVLLAGALGCAGARARRDRTDSAPRSSDWLGLLPEGEAKRTFILDCTGCHTLDSTIARNEGRPRTEAEWRESVVKMLGFAGATSQFPVIALSRHLDSTAAFLTAHLTSVPVARHPAGLDEVANAVTEFDLPVASDLPHDVAIDASGRVVVTGMFSHMMFVLDPATGHVDSVGFPFAHANPRAVEIDSSGAWWVALGAPMALARYAPSSKKWETFPIGFYPHSLALGRSGDVWANGHFTRDPELIARIRWPRGTRDSFVVTPHPTLAKVAGGPIPYELRVAPDGRVWGSELVGNRIFVCDPSTGATRAWAMPEPHMGPRRFDIDPSGMLWIPAYAANELVRFDPRTESFRRFPLYRLPSHGAMVRHLAVDPRNGDVWIAYGASPGPLPSRIARLSPTGTQFADAQRAR